MISLEHISLLYAEDELETLRQYEKYFKNYFKEVYTATNGRQAEELYQQQKPDVVILDINMPKLSGLDLCKKIRQHDKSTKIILLTARTDQKAFLDAIELGLTTYLVKPVFTEDLKKALRKISDEFLDLKRIKLWYHDEKHYIWDSKNRELFYGAQNIALTKKEKLLLELFITSGKGKQTYLNIHNTVWYDDIHKDYSEYSIKTLIKGLREKLPPHAIKNTYGLGFYLNNLLKNA
ncbi:MAG: response regulator transcription factor [Pseudomonadota bacterium]